MWVNGMLIIYLNKTQIFTILTKIYELGQENKDRAKEFKFGQMVLSMKVCGKKIRQMAKGDQYMLMVMYMMANGIMIKLMVKENLFMQMELLTMETGQKISNRALVML